ncbi:MAG: organomercurial lyase [Alphaproteobacteria bacterium]
MQQHASRVVLDSIRSMMDRGGAVGDDGPEAAQLAVELYRMLARGVPVTAVALARRLSMKPERCRATLEGIRASAIDYDDTGGIVGFAGLSLAPTAHRFRLAGHNDLYTWCTFDAFFLPQVLDRAAVLETTCATTRVPIVVELSPSGDVATTPASAVMSMVAPDLDAFAEDLRGAFCQYVRLFCDVAAFETWAADRPDVAMLTPHEAAELARARNRRRYPFL